MADFLVEALNDTMHSFLILANIISTKNITPEEMNRLKYVEKLMRGVEEKIKNHNNAESTDNSDD